MKTIKTMDDAMTALKTDEGADRLGHFACMDFELLQAIAFGNIDAGAVARAVLSGRGVNLFGKWVGFDQARVIWTSADDKYVEAARILDQATIRATADELRLWAATNPEAAELCSAAELAAQFAEYIGKPLA